MQEHSLVLQYRIDGWGSTEDLERRNHLEDLINPRLQEDNNGECDGGDIGSGTINLYLEGVIDPQSALNTVLAVLKEAEELEGAVIAQSHYSNTEGEEDRELEGYTVLWPSDHKGEFEIMYL
jgi:hypothetical protein